MPKLLAADFLPFLIIAFFGSLLIGVLIGVQP